MEEPVSGPPGRLRRQRGGHEGEPGARTAGATGRHGPSGRPRTSPKARPWPSSQRLTRCIQQAWTSPRLDDPEVTASTADRPTTAGGRLVMCAAAAARCASRENVRRAVSGNGRQPGSAHPEAARPLETRRGCAARDRRQRPTRVRLLADTLGRPPVRNSHATPNRGSIRDWAYAQHGTKFEGGTRRSSTHRATLGPRALGAAFTRNNPPSTPPDECRPGTRRKVAILATGPPGRPVITSAA